MSLTKREIERRVAAVSSTGLTVSGVRFLPDGSMLVETAETIRAANGADDADALYEECKKSAPRREDRPQARRA